jgi:hypothetical protein
VRDLFRKNLTQRNFKYISLPGNAPHAIAVRFPLMSSISI